MLGGMNYGWPQETDPTSRIDAMLAEGARERLTREEQYLQKNFLKASTSVLLPSNRLPMG